MNRGFLQRYKVSVYYIANPVDWLVNFVHGTSQSAGLAGCRRRAKASKPIPSHDFIQLVVSSF